MNDDMNLWRNNEPVCPTCGKAMMDAWELNLSDGESVESDCGHCNEPMSIECSVSVEYTTAKVKK